MLWTVVDFTSRAVFFVAGLSIGAIGVVTLAFAPPISRLTKVNVVAVAVCLCAATVCVQYLFLTVAYLLVPGYFDHVESTVAVMAALLLRGEIACQFCARLSPSL